MLYYALSQPPSVATDDLAVLALNLLMLAVAACHSGNNEEVCVLCELHHTGSASMYRMDTWCMFRGHAHMQVTSCYHAT